MATSTRLPTNSVNNPGGLDLASGMTAGIGPEQLANTPGAGSGLYGSRPKAWPTILRLGAMRSLLGSPSAAQLNSTIGTGGGVTSIAANGAVSSAGINQSAVGKTYTMYFLYNPNQITDSFSIDPGSLPPASLATSGIPVVPNAISAQTIAWSLFFDRTYDMINDMAGNSRGVLHDVAALFNLIGEFETYGNTPLLNPVQVIFGMDSQSSSPGALWGFQGYITNVTITYGIFKRDMMPSRCEIDLEMTARYLPVSTPSTALLNQVQSSALNAAANQISVGTPPGVSFGIGG